MIKKRTIQKFNSFIVMILLFSVSIILPLNINVELAKAGSTWTDSSEQDFNNGTINNLTIKGTGMDAELMNEFSDPPVW